MTLMLVRMGLPNSVVLLALAIMPIVAIASATRTELARSPAPAPAIVAAVLDPAFDAAPDERASVAE